LETHGVARMWSIGSRDGVGFPEIHFRAARTHGTASGVGIASSWCPSLNVGLTSDELHVMWALRIAVTSSVFGTSLIGWVLGHTTILVHLDKVDGAVKTARKVADINVKCNFLVQWLEHEVGGIGLHQVDTRSNVGARRLGNELESEGITAGGDTVDTRVIGTFKSAVGGAGDIVRAKSFVPGVTSIAVGKAGSAVKPSPVGVNDNLCALGNATTRDCALVRSESWVGLSSVGTNLLGADVGNEGREKSDLAESRHFDDLGREIN